MGKKVKNIILIVGIFIALFFAYSYFFKSNGETGTLVATNTTSPRVGNDLILLLLQIKKLTIDDSIFTAKSFQSLKDFGTEIKTQPVGRDNPFAPIGVEGNSSAIIQSGTATST